METSVRVYRLEGIGPCGFPSIPIPAGDYWLVQSEARPWAPVSLEIRSEGPWVKLPMPRHADAGLAYRFRLPECLVRLCVHGSWDPDSFALLIPAL